MACAIYEGNIVSLATGMQVLPVMVSWVVQLWPAMGLISLHQACAGRPTN